MHINAWIWMFKSRFSNKHFTEVSTTIRKKYMLKNISERWKGEYLCVCAGTHRYHTEAAKILWVLIITWSICYPKKHSSGVWYMRKLLGKWLFGNGPRIVSLEFSPAAITQRRKGERNPPLPSYWNGWQVWELSVLSLWRKCGKQRTTAKQQGAEGQTQQPLTASLEYV